MRKLAGLIKREVAHTCCTVYGKLCVQRECFLSLSAGDYLAQFCDSLTQITLFVEC